MKSQNEREMDLEDKVSELERTVEKLRVALKPFADCDLERYGHREDRTFMVGTIKGGVDLGDFRNAHDVLYPPSVK